MRTSWTTLAREAIACLRHSPVVRLATAAVLLLAVATGVVEAVAGSLSGAEFLVLGLAVVAVLGVWGARRSARILPFANLVGTAESKRFEALAAGFAQNLDLEIGRILRLRESSSPDSETAGLDNAGPKLGQTPIRSKRTADFKGTTVISGTESAIGETQVGSVDVGPLRLPLGSLLNVAARALGRAISGSILAGPHHVRVVAAYSGRPRHKWQAERELTPEESPVGQTRELARELAYQIVWDLGGSTSTEADWRSFGHVIDGIEHFERFRRGGEPADLDLAESIFLAAIARSPRFAAAYHNLAVVHAERARDGLANEAGEASSGSTALALWQRAVELDPKFADPHLHLARVAYELGDLDTSIDSAKKAIHLSERGGGSCAASRYWLGQALLIRAQKGEPAMAQAAVRELHMAEGQLVELRHNLRLGEGTHAQLRAVEGELARIARARGEAHELLASAVGAPPQPAADGLGPKNPGAAGHLREAEKAFRSAVELQPEQSGGHADLGAFLARHGREDAAEEELVEALRLDPRNADAVWALGEMLASSDDPDSHHAAALAFRVSLAFEPRDPDPWVMLARYAESRNQIKDAVTLTTMAATLRPSDPQIYDQLAGLWAHRVTADGLAAEERVQTYTHLRQALEEALAEGGPGNEFRRVDDLLAALPVSEEGTGAGHHQRAVLSWARAWIEARLHEEEADALRPVLGALDQLSGPAVANVFPEASLPPYEIGRLHSMVGGAEHQARAIDYLERATRRELPGGMAVPASWLIDLADAYAAAERYEEAIEAYSRALKVVPELLDVETRSGRRAHVRGEAAGLGIQARALAGRGEAHLALGHDSEARRDCEQAIGFEPLYAFPHHVLATLFSKRGDHDRAIQLWRRFEALLPTVPVYVHSNVGDAIVDAAAEARAGSQQEKDLLRQAVGEYERALAGSRESVEEVSIRGALADCLERLGHAARALGERERAARAATGLAEEADARTRLGGAYNSVGRWADAEEQYRKVVQLRRHQLAQSRERGRGDGGGGDGGQVAGDADASARTDAERDMADALNEMAWFYAEQAFNLDEGLRMAGEAVDLVAQGDDLQRWAMCLDTWAWLAYELGDLKAAAAKVEEAVKVAIPTSERRAHLAIVLEALAEEDPDAPRRRDYLKNAEHHWRRILDLDPDGTWATRARQRLSERGLAT